MPKHGDRPAMDDKYQAEDDARTMKMAMEIAKDPARMKACVAQMKKQMGEMEGAISMIGGMNGDKAGSKLAGMMKG